MSPAVVAEAAVVATRDARAIAALVTTRLRGFDVLERGALPSVLAGLDDPRRGARRGETISSTERRGLALIEAVLRRIPGVPATCLVRSLARFAAFARAGLDVRFVMALRPEGDDHDVIGHAWVEIDGAPFDEIVDARLVETFAFPPRSLVTETSRS